MIDPGYAKIMSAYGTAMNHRLFAAAERLDDAARRRDRGAFWRSIHGTLSHLLWADILWMSRLDGWEPPRRPLNESWLEFPDFAGMAATRQHADQRLETWAAARDDGWLAGTQSWFSHAQNRQCDMPRQFVVMHLFNHATHHRGQVHAMLTAAGVGTGDTDLTAIVDPALPAPQL